jgi:membrane fusion protein (multidrug efflux system)
MDKRFVTRLLIMLAVVGFFFGGLFGFKAFGNKKMNEFFDSMPIPPVAITSAEAQRLEWTNELEAVGSLVPINGVAVTTEAAGLVHELHFESGQRVKAGALLVTLELATEQADLKNLEAQATLAELDFKRLERLHALEAISGSELDQARATLDSARAQVQAQRARIAQKAIRAPFAGELGIRRVNLGQYLNPGDEIVQLQAVDPIYVDFQLPEQQLGRVKPGLELSLTSDAYPGEIFRGTVLAVEPRVDSATRNFSIRGELANPDLKLRPGAFADVTLSLPGSRQAVVVPRTAISYSAYGNAVFIIKPAEGGSSTVSQRFVKTGEARGDFVEISEGLEGGEQVATSALFRLQNDATVTIQNALAPDLSLNPAVPEG